MNNISVIQISTIIMPRIKLHYIKSAVTYIKELRNNNEQKGIHRRKRDKHSHGKDQCSDLRG